jgi:hypothetical protein
MDNYTDEQKVLALRIKLREDFTFFAPSVLRIMPKGTIPGAVENASHLVPFHLNAAQLRTHIKIEQQLATFGYVRVIVLKARQMGFSTYVEGRYYHKVSNHYGKRCIIMTEADQSRDNIFNMVKTYHDNVPEEIKPSTTHCNEKSLIFNDTANLGLQSRYDVKTCDSKGGLGITVQYVHLSELAYYPDTTVERVSGLLESVPSESPGLEGTEVIIESTADGMGGLFYDIWTSCMEKIDKGEEPEYLPIFEPWFAHPGYAHNKLVPNSDPWKKIEDTLSDDEEELIKTFNVGIPQLSWRRWKINKTLAPIGYTAEDYFKQWYPSTPEEAFVFSGRTVFPKTYMISASPEVYSPAAEGQISVTDGTFSPNPTIIKEPNAGNLQNLFRIWEFPKPGVDYGVGVDVSEGIDKGDYNCADVLRADGVQVAQWWGKCDPDLWGLICYRIAQYYNDALLGIECNNHGHSVLNTVKTTEYHRIYQREVLDSIANDKLSKKAGWLTTSTTKNRIVNRVLGKLREQNSGVRCRETYKEMLGYMIQKDGSYGAKSGQHDDRVMAFCIAHEMVTHLFADTVDSKKVTHPEKRNVVIYW